MLPRNEWMYKRKVSTTSCVIRLAHSVGPGIRPSEIAQERAAALHPIPKPGTRALLLRRYSANPTSAFTQPWERARRAQESLAPKVKTCLPPDLPRHADRPPTSLPPPQPVCGSRTAGLRTHDDAALEHLRETGLNSHGAGERACFHGSSLGLGSVSVHGCDRRAGEATQRGKR